MLDAIAEELGRALERAALLESERDARRQAEFLERNAARLAGRDDGRGGRGFDRRGVRGVRGGRRLRVEGQRLVEPRDPGRVRRAAGDTGSLRQVPARARRAGVGRDADEEPRRDRVGDEYAARYPALEEERRRLGVESLAALPLRTSSGAVVGAIFAASAERRWVNEDRRPLLLGVAEQIGVALERAELQAEAERTAAASSFLALVGESLERVTTVSVRARRLVEVLTEERATFAAVHLIDEDGVVDEIASGGSRPPELEDDDRWADWIARTISTGRETSPDRLDGRRRHRSSVAARAAAPRAGAQPRRADGPERSRRRLAARHPAGARPRDRRARRDRSRQRAALRARAGRLAHAAARPARR